jgi:hypothetical protein
MKPCKITERRGHGRTMVFCDCGWQITVRHSNALARVSKAKGEANQHLRRMAAKTKEMQP